MDKFDVLCSGILKANVGKRKVMITERARNQAIDFVKPYRQHLAK